MFVEGRERQVARGALHDVFTGKKGCFVEGFDATPVEEFRYHSGNAAARVLPDEFRKGLLGVVPFEDFGDLKSLRKSGQIRSGSRHLDSTDHVATHNRKQRRRIGANEWSEALLKHLQEIALGQVHLENGMQRCIPAVRLGPHRHGE